MKDESIQEGDMLSRAMPNLNEEDVAELKGSVQPLLDEDDGLRAWCCKDGTFFLFYFFNALLLFFKKTLENVTPKTIKNRTN